MLRQLACDVVSKNKCLDILVSSKVTFYKYTKHGTDDKGEDKLTSRDIASLPTYIINSAWTLQTDTKMTN